MSVACCLLHAIGCIVSVCVLPVACCAQCDGIHAIAYVQNARAFKGESLHALNVLSLDSILAIVNSISCRCAVRAPLPRRSAAVTFKCIGRRARWHPFVPHLEHD